jgi:hypothetical protein
VAVFDPLLDAAARKFGHQAREDLVQPLADHLIVEAETQGLQAGDAFVAGLLAVIEIVLQREVGLYRLIAICNRKGVSYVTSAIIAGSG